MQKQQMVRKMFRKNDYSSVITHLIEHLITQYLQAGPNNLEDRSTTGGCCDTFAAGCHFNGIQATMNFQLPA